MSRSHLYSYPDLCTDPIARAINHSENLNKAISVVLNACYLRPLTVDEVKLHSVGERIVSPQRPAVLAPSDLPTMTDVFSSAFQGNPCQTEDGAFYLSKKIAGETPVAFRVWSTDHKSEPVKDSECISLIRTGFVGSVMPLGMAQTLLIHLKELREPVIVNGKELDSLSLLRAKNEQEGVDPCFKPDRLERPVMWMARRMDDKGTAKPHEFAIMQPGDFAVNEHGLIYYVFNGYQNGVYSCGCNGGEKIPTIQLVQSFFDCANGEISKMTVSGWHWGGSYATGRVGSAFHDRFISNIGLNASPARTRSVFSTDDIKTLECAA